MNIFKIIWWIILFPSITVISFVFLTFLILYNLGWASLRISTVTSLILPYILITSLVLGICMLKKKKNVSDNIKTIKKEFKEYTIVLLICFLLGTIFYLNNKCNNLSIENSKLQSRINTLTQTINLLQSNSNYKNYLEFKEDALKNGTYEMPSLTPNQVAKP